MLGILLNRQANGPKRGILRNSFSRPVGWVGCGSRANGAPCPTPIDVAGPGDRTVRSLGSVRNVREGPGGSGESWGPTRPLGSVHSSLKIGARDRQGNSGLVSLLSGRSVHRAGVGALGGSVGPGGQEPLGSVHRAECADGRTDEL